MLEILRQLGIPFIIFGAIFLIIGLIAGNMMQKEVMNPNCPEDRNNVKRNKIWYKWLMIICPIIILIGLLFSIFL